MPIFKNKYAVFSNFSPSGVFLFDLLLFITVLKSGTGTTDLPTDYFTSSIFNDFITFKPSP